MHPSARPTSANMSRIVARGVARKNSSSGTEISLLQEVCHMSRSVVVFQRSFSVELEKIL
jgi:hypothetical protein